MKYEIKCKPAFAAIFLTLEPGERIVAEAGAMASMDSAITMRTSFSGGLIPALLKHFLGGESIFVNEFINQSDSPRTIVLTQSTIGDIETIELNNKEMYFQPGAYIASTRGVKLGVGWAGFASFIAGEGLFKLTLKGRGLVFFGAYGGIGGKRVTGDFIVDNGHLVAYEAGIKMNIRFAGGIFSSVTSGEGLVNHLKGNGMVYLQSRSLDSLVRFVRPKLRG